VELTFAYLGRSAVDTAPGRASVSLAPNLKRPPVYFEGELARPLRFREAVSALHDVVISDLRFKPRDHSAYREWLQRQKENERAQVEKKKKELMAQRAPAPPGIHAQFEKLRGRYWSARQNYSDYLQRNDPGLWRLLMPCDPIITVADDVVFFECFSADESSYGCLSVDLDGGFKGAQKQNGTTNVDYSWTLYDHFQTLRSYRETRFGIDPRGFEVSTKGAGAGVREEKIDLPESWLRGFLQLQAAMLLPTRKVTLTREALYNVLAHLRRHRARKSPRSLRFELQPGAPVSLVLEPWDLRIASSIPYAGERQETIRLWGRQRMLVLGRLLPMIDSIDAYLIGSGLPGFWVANMGEMKLTVGLSGWTVNDWTRASNLDLMAPLEDPDPVSLKRVQDSLEKMSMATLAEIQAKSGAGREQTASCLNRLARFGRVIYDFPRRVYRWRAVMPPEVPVHAVARESDEAKGARELISGKQVRVTSDQTTKTGLRALEGTAGNRPVELLVDADGTIRRASCNCSLFYRMKLKQGPCRHIAALRVFAYRG
jgi:hypothetical protein